MLRAVLFSCFLSCPCRYYTEVFLEIAGPVNRTARGDSSSSSSSSYPRALRRQEGGGREKAAEEDEKKKKKQRRANPLAGVLGLAALVHAAPFDIPPWLPHAITSLAKYASSKMPDNVRVSHALKPAHPPTHSTAAPASYLDGSTCIYFQRPVEKM